MSNDRRQEWFRSQLREIDDIHETFQVSADESLRIRMDVVTTNFGLEVMSIEEESAIAAFAQRLAKYRSSAELKGKRHAR